MNNYFSNTGYFLKETKTVISTNWLSNLLTFLSTGLIFFILTLILSAWWISNQVVEVIQGEAQISVYFQETLDDRETTDLLERIREIEGVREAQIVEEGEAYERMVEILGKEARVLEFFDESPFTAFIEVQIHLEAIDPVLEKLESIQGVGYIRDNREVLDRIQHITKILRVVGLFLILAAGITTLVIISHMIRLGVYNNREQINTLRLLGAPEPFIALPFLLVGLLLTLGGGLLATALGGFSLNYLYSQMTGPLPFIPLPPREKLFADLTLWITSLSIMLGMLGSLMGLVSAKRE